jgi:hypothetical protein
MSESRYNARGIPSGKMLGISKRTYVILEIWRSVENPANGVKSTGTHRIEDDPFGKESITLLFMCSEKRYERI